MDLMREFRGLFKELFFPLAADEPCSASKSPPKQASLLSDYIWFLKRYLAEGGKIDAFHSCPLPEKEIAGFLNGGLSPWASRRLPLYEDVLLAMAHDGWVPLPEHFVPSLSQTMPVALSRILSDHSRKMIEMKAALEKEMCDPTKVRAATPHDYAAFLKSFAACGGTIVREASVSFASQAFLFVMAPLAVPVLRGADALNLIVPPRVLVSFPAGLGHSRVYKTHTDGSARAKGVGDVLLFADVKPFVRNGVRRFLPRGFSF